MSNATRNSHRSPSAAPRPRILLVDGDPDTRALYRVMFPPEHYTVDESDDGAEALGRALTQPPDLVIMETHLRRIDGVHLCELLRTDVLTRSTRIIMVTSAASAADNLRATRAGADAVLIKPCRYEDVVAVARGLLDAGRTPNAAESPEADAATVEPAAPAASDARTRMKSRSFKRERSTTPALQPPSLRCPTCDGFLHYQHSHTGGVNADAPEQWDYFICAGCGPFQYRHRTRRLKPTGNTSSNVR